ncbi:MAG: tandem-95 repeat protein, partial [Methylococcales bacterium]|nr:tandem-95 repeat protein [Methylococcales bacterium]
GTNGTVVLNANGTVTFTSTPNFNGVATFSYQASDGTTTSNAATVTINVFAINDAPVAVADTLTATEDTAIIYTAAQLIGNDTDAENNPLTIASVTSGANGTAVLNPDGTVTFTPNANFNGVADFTYQVKDTGLLLSNSATVTVNVTAVNDAPVAVADTLSAIEDTAITYLASDLLGNDTDVDGNPLTIASVTNGSNGTVVLNPDGSVTFTPTADFNGAADFSYQTSDGTVNSNSATVTVNVSAVNDAPVAVADTLTAIEDTAIIYLASDLLGNDTDADGNPLTIASVTSGVNGTAVLNADGTVTFTPAANFNGAADFSYQANDGTANSNSATVTVNVTAVNDAPVANPNTVAANEDTAITYTAIQLLGNDTDVDGNPLTIGSVTNGINGTVVLNGDGSVTFTPAPNFNGVADFSYQATDGNLLSNPATVTVNVAAINDAPIAVADTLTATEDTPITYTAAQLLVNDSDAENDVFSILTVTSGTNGIAVLNADGSITFTPDANFNGIATFSYQLTDGILISAPATVTVTVEPVNDAPVAVANTLAANEDTAITYLASDLLGNDTDIDGNPLTIASVTSGTNGTAVLNANGTVTFTPAANFNGAATFSYQATDGTANSNSATVTVNVAAVNDAPVAIADTLDASEDTVIIYTAAQLLGNDTDVDGNPLTIAGVVSGSNGTAVLNPDGTVTFTPDANFNGVATFSYQATDGILTSSPAQVTVNVAAVNDAPVANPETMNALEDTATTYTAFQLLGNDTDIDGNPLTIASVSNGTNGTVVLNANGTVTFTSTPNFNGVATFSYQASDGTTTSNAATVTI